MDEGAYYGVVTFVQKLGTGIATILIGPILEFAGGYKSPPKDQPEDVLFQQDNTTNQIIRILFVGLSAVIILLGALAIFKYTLDREALKKKLAE